jgi:drug/metabolite transporter (DMT)-like permease
MVAATAFFAGTTLLAKALGAGALGQVVHPLQVSQGRFLFGCLAVLVVASLIPRGPEDRAAPSPHWVWHAARTALGVTGGACLFAAAAQMPLADANALGFLSPVVTMLLAIPFLGERVGRWRWAAAGIAFVGALILVRPGAGVIQPAALLALGAAALMGAEGIFIKKLATREPPRQVLIVNNAMGAVLASGLGLWVFDWPTNAAVWAAMAGVGVLMVSGQLLFLLANRLGEASYVAPFFYLALVWAALYDLAAFGVWPDGVTLLGAATVVAGGVLMAWREALARKRAPVLGDGP